MAANAEKIKLVSLYDIDHTLVFSPKSINPLIEETLKEEVSKLIVDHSEVKQRDNLQLLLKSMNLPIVVDNIRNQEMGHFLFTDMLFGRNSIQERKNLVTILQYIYQVTHPDSCNLPDIEVITPSDLFWSYVYAAGAEAIDILWNKKLNQCHKFDALTVEDLISFFNDVQEQVSPGAKENFEQIIDFLKDLDSSKQQLFKSIPGNAFATAKQSDDNSSFIYRCSVISKILVEKLARHQGYQHPKSIMLKHFKSRNADLAITIYDDNTVFLSDVLTHFIVSPLQSKSKRSRLARKFKSSFTSRSKGKKSDEPLAPALTVFAVIINNKGKIQCLPATDTVAIEKKRLSLCDDYSSQSSLFITTRSHSAPTQFSQTQTWVSARPSDLSNTTL